MGRLTSSAIPTRAIFRKKPESSSAIHSSSSLPPSVPWSADGSMDVEQPLPSIPEEPSPLSCPDLVQLSRDDAFHELWLHLRLFSGPEDYFAKLESSSSARPSSISPPSGPAGQTDLKQPLPSVPAEPSPVQPGSCAAKPRRWVERAAA